MRKIGRGWAQLPLEEQVTALRDHALGQEGGAARCWRPSSGSGSSSPAASSRGLTSSGRAVPRDGAEQACNEQACKELARMVSRIGWQPGSPPRPRPARPRRRRRPARRRSGSRGRGPGRPSAAPPGGDAGRRPATAHPGTAPRRRRPGPARRRAECRRESVRDGTSAAVTLRWTDVDIAS